MILKISGKILTYLGFLLGIAELTTQLCPICGDNVCPFIMFISILMIIAGCIIHEIDEEEDKKNANKA